MMMILKIALLAIGVVVTAVTAKPSVDEARCIAASEVVGSLVSACSTNS